MMDLIGYHLMMDLSWVEVNADGSEEEVARRLQELVDVEVDSDHGELGLLWMITSEEA